MSTDIKEKMIKTARSNHEYWLRMAEDYYKRSLIAVGFERTVLPIDIPEGRYYSASLVKGDSDYHFEVNVVFQYDRSLIRLHRERFEAAGWKLVDEQQEKDIRDGSDPYRRYESEEGDVAMVSYSDNQSDSTCHRVVRGYVTKQEPIYSWECDEQ